MTQKFKNIFSIILVLALLTPSVVKLEHHHKHFFCNAKNEKHFHELHEKCPVCSFEYSVFIPEKNNYSSTRAVLIGTRAIDFYSCFYSNSARYSFLLRAPPVFTNSI